MNSLKGRTIAITRNEKEAAEFSALVEGEGGRAIALPTVDIVPLDQMAAKRFVGEISVDKHEYCAFVSAQAVDVLFGMAQGAEILESLKATKIIAVGPKTKSKLEEFGARVALTPEKYSSKGLVEMLSRMEPAGKKIIIPRSAAAGNYAAEALRALGMIVTEIELYKIRTLRPSEVWRNFARMLESRQVDAVIFTSASNVNAFFDILGSIYTGGTERIALDLSRLAKIISIGPSTSEELRKRKVEYVEAREHTVRGTFELANSILHPK